MHLFYYVTSHGYGHGVRTCSIADTLPPQCQITFRTTLPEHFFKEELRRDFAYLSGEFDCGCLQTDGVTTNVAATLEHYKKIAARNETLLDNEIRLCKTQNVDLIIGDITPFAFEIASRLGIRSIAISNFSWYDIYEEYCAAYPQYTSMIEKIHLQYTMADELIALAPALPMPYFRKRHDVTIVGRKGKNVRDKITAQFNIAPSKKIGLIYVGNFGMHTAHWKKLEQFTNWEFIGVYPLQGDPANFHLITKDQFRYQDLIASTDAMFSKLGYGAVSESMLNGKPIVYLPRTLFAEYPVLEKAVTDWGGGIKIETDAFYNLEWGDALDRIEHHPVEPVHSSGIDEVIKIIMNT